jgi:exodeoxyribonuclease VII small subunit
VTTRPDVEALSYEQARDELVGIVAKLEIGAVTLEESLELWERGEALAVRCQHILQGARERVADAGGDRASDKAGDDASPDAGTSE